MCRYHSAILLVIVFVILGGGVATVMASTRSESEQVEELLEKADTLFQDERYYDCYKICQDILAIEPFQQEARTTVFVIAVLYQQRQQHMHIQGGGAATEKDSPLESQQYEEIVYYWFNFLTTQLEQLLQQYANFPQTSKVDTDRRQEFVALLASLVNTLRDTKKAYEQFGQTDDHSAQERIERLQQAITHYEQELSYYQK